MSFDPGLQLGDVIDNKQLADIFRCSGQGGMRRSLKTETLVLISDYIHSIYENRWSGDIFYYTGMGQQGDQKLDFMQNKTLAESRQNGVDIHLFEVFEKGQYTYMGKVELAKIPFLERQPDADGNLRQVWVFPLQMVDAAVPIALPKELIEKNKGIRKKRPNAWMIANFSNVFNFPTHRQPLEELSQPPMCVTPTLLNMLGGAQKANVSFVTKKHLLLTLMVSPF